ncbi:hypothetical protein VOLCADRAFT_100243 [Volvox carteri f. nagariensis]|uniref:Uncharacterized protein n=1 Tax=Volvox carteri f. nagariensis TaxID=3068 RepID=D8UJT1_VOLCA|nr:uncharacterized protein VOLCADRAFT_100243 [Volvox carteri f. nagariensis]EFJ39995.1 hypothetical protein VOLCADRAFT_100243 [Volvox carteri f. nagariensis]|eukprot:XP_002958915.1 hypothetical protein VOLCADRAFT_100243 [Volvox carteri f. nagariensis]
MEGRLANLAGEVSALRSQLEDLRKLHGELAAEGDLLHARLQSLPENTKHNRSSDEHALGSGSTRGSDPGSTFHFSMFTTAEPSSPGGHASVDRRYPQSKSRAVAPDSRSADDHAEHLAQGPPLALDPWDEIMMSNYNDDGPEPDGPSHLAAGSTTGSPATGLNATLNTSTPRLPGSGVASVGNLSSTPGVGGGGGGAPALAAPLAVGAAGQLDCSSPAAAAAAAGASTRPSEPSGGSGEEPGFSVVPAAMDPLCWQQQQQQQHLSGFVPPCNVEGSFPNPLEHPLQLQPPPHLQPPIQEQPQLHAGQQQHPYTAGALRQPAVTCSLSLLGDLPPTSPQPVQSRQLPWQQQPHLPLPASSHQELEDTAARQSTGDQGARWSAAPPHLDGAANAHLRGSGGGETAPGGAAAVGGSVCNGAAASPYASAAVEAAVVVVGDGAAGPADDMGAWLASGRAATAAGPLSGSPSPALTLTGGIGPPAAAAAAAAPSGAMYPNPFLRSDSRGLSLASRLSGGVIRGGVTRNGKCYAGGGGPAAAAAALLHGAGMSPVCGLGPLGATGLGVGAAVGGEAMAAHGEWGEMAGNGGKAYQQQQLGRDSNVNSSGSPLNQPTQSSGSAGVPGPSSLPGVPGSYGHSHPYNMPYGPQPPPVFAAPYSSPNPLPIRCGSGSALDRSVEWRRAPGVRHPAMSPLAPPTGDAVAGAISPPPPGLGSEPDAPHLQ